MIYTKVKQPRVNFFKCFTEEEPNQGLYNDLYKIGEEKFNIWFSENAITFEVKCAKEIEPPTHIVKKLSKEKIYKQKVSQCHYNSQVPCLLYNELEFYTGLLFRCDDEITHSFCMLNDKIVDFTAKYFLEPDEDGFNKNYFPYLYIGVKVEKSFLFSKMNEIFENGYATNPYLYEWYLETCKDY